MSPKQGHKLKKKLKKKQYFAQIKNKTLHYYFPTDKLSKDPIMNVTFHSGDASFIIATVRIVKSRRNNLQDITD